MKYTSFVTAVLLFASASVAYATPALQDQTITFNALVPKVVTAADFTVSATASSNLTVTFASTTPTVCSVTGTTVDVLTAGSCSITASQAGDGSYNPAPDVSQAFSVVETPTTVYVDPTFSTTYGDVTSGNHTAGIDAFTTISDAMNAVATEGTVSVTGTHTGDVTITKSLILTGTNATIEGKVQINTDDVTVQNLTIHNPNGNFGVLINHVSNVMVLSNTISNVGTGTATGNAYGVYFQDGDSISNSNISISSNTISSIGAATNGSNGGIGIGDSTGTGDITGVSISNNTISSITANPTAVSPGKGAYGIIVNHASGVGANTGTTIVDISGNTISNLSGRWAHGIGMEGETPESSITFNTMSNFTATSASNDAVGIMFESNTYTNSVVVENNFINTQSIAFGVTNVTSGVAKVQYNDWNTPNPTSKITGSASFAPWWKPDTEMTVPQFPTVTTGSNTTATVTSTYCNNTRTRSKTASAASICIDIAGDSSNSITGPTTWDGTIDGPTFITVTNPSVTGSTTTGSVAFSFGSELGSLQFSAPIRLTFYGEAGKEVGWALGSGAFTPITNVCTSNSAAGLGTNQDCKINAEDNLVVWTRHLTTFTTYTSTPTPVSGGNGPIVQTGYGPTTSGIASGGSTSNPTQTFDSTHVATQEQNGVNTDNTNTSGIVAGATKFKFINNMSYGSRLDPDVTELHKFLIAKGLLQIKAPTGWFGPLTRAAVKKYQKAKQLPETGVVGDMTRNALNQEE